jgi:hypothetical protein
MFQKSSSGRKSPKNPKTKVKLFFFKIPFPKTYILQISEMGGIPAPPYNQKHNNPMYQIHAVRESVQNREYRVRQKLVDQSWNFSKLFEILQTSRSPPHPLVQLKTMKHTAVAHKGLAKALKIAEKRRVWYFLKKMVVERTRTTIVEREIVHKMLLMRLGIFVLLQLEW